MRLNMFQNQYLNESYIIKLLDTVYVYVFVLSIGIAWVLD